MKEDTKMPKKIESFDEKSLKSIFRQILALSDENKAYLMGYLLISPWQSITWEKYLDNLEWNVHSMLEWLNDRLLYQITKGKKGSESIIHEEEDIEAISKRKKVKRTKLPKPENDKLLHAYAGALLNGEGIIGTKGEPPSPYISIVMRSKNPLKIVESLFSEEKEFMRKRRREAERFEPKGDYFG